MKRKLKWLAIVLAVSLLGFGTALLLWPRDRITAESWKQIQIGMSEKEVEGILGGPGTDYVKWLKEYEAWLKTEQNEPLVPNGIRFDESNGVQWNPEKHKLWFGRRGSIEIQFDDEGIVRGKIFEGLRPTDPSFFDRLRDWLGW